MGRAPRDELERFCSHVSVYSIADNPCLYWDGALNKDGYGQFRAANGKLYYCHRWVACQTFGEEIMDGMDAHHLCGERSCVNPTHLVPAVPEQHRMEARMLRILARA